MPSETALPKDELREQQHEEPTTNNDATDVQGEPGSGNTDDDDVGDTHFPFDLVLVFDDFVKGAKEYADNLYNDLVHDGLVACKYVKPYRNGTNRIFVGVGASDRFLHGVVQHYHFSEERTEARSHKGINRIYAQNTRQRILMRFFKLRRYGGPHASFQWLQDSGILLDYYLLHDPCEVRDLRKGFFTYVFLPKYTFIADVEEYFGEELAMYMAWLRTLIVFTGPICIIYAVFFAFEIAGDYESWSMAAAGYFAPVYLQFFHEYWKRQEKRLAFEFGTLDLEETAEVREGYRGTQRLVQWTREKRLRHEGEDEDTIIVKAGRFELPIQHSVPVHRSRMSYRDPASPTGAGSPLTASPTGAAFGEDQDPFEVKVVQQLNFDALPEYVMERHYPETKRWFSYMFSIPTSLTFCAAVMVAIYAIDFIREVLSDDTGTLRTDYSITISIINGVVIVFFNSIYPIVTLKLCEWENHRTRDGFENAYILKLFIFVFINSYFPIFLQVFKLYIIESDKLSAQGKTERIQAVVVQIFSACVSTVFVSNIQDLIVPFFLGPALDRIRVWWSGKQRKETMGKTTKGTEPIAAERQNEPVAERDDSEEMSPTSADREEKKGNFISRKFTRMESRHHTFEHQMQLSEPQPVTARFMGRIILFGFALIFAALFPLGMFFVFLDAVLTTRVEIIRYLYLMRRMMARQVESIGGWRVCIQFMIVVAAITNCLVLALRTDSLVEWYGANREWESRLTIFIASEHIVMFFVFAVEYVIPDTSRDIMQIKALQKYLMLKDQNRLTYDPIDLQMPSHILIDENILPNDTNTIANDLCVQCHVPLHPGEDLVRKFPCHHHIHEKCLQDFIRTASVEDDSGNGGVAICPSCGLEIDTRYFGEHAAYQKYAPVRYRIIDEIAMDPEVRSESLKELLEQENKILTKHSEWFGLKGDNAFPSPGPAPTGHPPRPRQANQDSSAFFEY